MTTRRYELTISTNYVPNWTYIEAIRELFQNALDEQTVDPRHVMDRYYDPMNQCFTISNQNTALDTSSLLLGSGTKASDNKLIGQHGEGYKIAFMVLLREGKKITVENPLNNQYWTVYLKKTKKYGGQPVVAIKVEEMHSLSNFLKVIVEGISEEEMEAIAERNLHLNWYPKHWFVPDTGKILFGEKYKGKVFVNGLYVTTLEEFQFGYDLLPNKLQMDRDRSLVRSFDLSWNTSLMWKQAYASDWVEGNTPQKQDLNYALRQLLRDNKYDVRFINDRQLVRDNLALAYDVADDFVNEYGDDAVPVTTQSDAEAARVTGRKPVIVNQTVKDLIDSTDVIPEIKEDTPIQKLYAWYEAVKDRLTLEEKVEFEDIYSKL